jgi:phage-related protein (TIGR01555 family)
MSYSNIAARLGTGTTNLINQGDYPLTRISNNFWLLLSLYRGNWIVRKVVDVMAEDMLKDLPEVKSQVDPKLIASFRQTLKRTSTQAKLLEALKWGRLFGGAVAIIVIHGHDNLEEPLVLDDVELNSYRGLITLDRWSGVYPDAELIDDVDNAAEFGLPRYYSCDLGANGRRIRVHHSRVLRFIGRDLPMWEKQLELYWGMSEVELIFDELRKWDYTNWSSASLVSRANIWAVRQNDLAQAMSGASMNQALQQQYITRLQMIADAMSNQGLLALGKDDGLESHQQSFTGLSELLNTFALNICGATEYPMSKLFGRTITGLGQTGEGDLQNYYDAVEQKRQREVQPQIDKLYSVIAMSTWGMVPEDLDSEFPPLRTLTDKDRADLARSWTDSTLSAYNAGIFGRRTALKDLRQISNATGGVVFSNITDEMIDAADDQVVGTSDYPPVDVSQIESRKEESPQQ